MFYKGSIVKSSGGSGEAVWGDITGTLADQTDLAEALAAKQDTLTAGTGIDITNDVISVTGGGSTPESIIDARTETAIRLWTGNQTQYNDGGSVTFYNWQSGGTQEITTNVDIFPNNGIYGNGLYVIVGNSGKIATSTDGKVWTLQTSGTSEHLYGIIYDGTQFVATGNNGTIIKSTDGEFWEAINSGISTDLKEIAYGNGIYVIAPGVYYSSDLTTWNTTSVDSRGRVFFHKNNFYTCSYGGSGDSLYIYKSPDAVTWTSVTSPKVYDANWSIVSAANDYIYAGYSKYSDDGGTTWKSLTSGNSPSNVVYGNGIYAGTNYQHFSISTDGLVWTKVSDLYRFGTFPNKTIYGNGLFIWLSYNNSALKVVLYSDALSVYTTDEEPTTSSVVYSEPNVTSALTITSVGTGEITCSDTNTYTYNSAGNQTVTQTIGEAHPDWLCFIEGVGIKMGNVSFIPTVTVDQTYDATSANAQSGVAVASGISDTLGTIETALQGV